MTNEEIKKSLQTCNDADLSCKDCLYHDDLMCIDTLKTDAFKCIIKQEKKIEKLKAENKQLKTECALLDDELRIARQDTIDVLNKLKAENEELSKVVSSKVYDFIDNTKEIADAREAWEQQAKIEVLNELKEIIPLAMSKQYVCAQIDEMIKEQLKK